jgi:hypothetical protein
MALNHGQDDQSACILVCPGGYILQIVLDHRSKDLVPKNVEFDLTRNRIRLGWGMFFAERHEHEAHWDRHLPATQVGLLHIGTRAGMAIEGILSGSIARSVNSAKIQQVLLAAKPRHLSRGQPPRHFIARRPVLNSIFISYRRDDSEGEAGRLCDDLAEIFHEQSVFMDVNTIQPGRDFRKAIDESIHKCSVLLAIVGQGWLDSKDGSGQKRLDDGNDFVRLEIASALVRDIPVIPVLVRGAKMPRAEQLPADLGELAYRNAVELTHARWKSDLQVLIRALRPYMEAPDQEISRDNLSADGAISGPASSIPPPEVQAQPAAGPPGMEGADLQQLIRELAAYIGPIAEVVVKRAAKRATSRSDLCGKVAQQIDVSADRAKFLASCQRVR